MYSRCRYRRPRISRHRAAVVVNPVGRVVTPKSAPRRWYRCRRLQPGVSVHKQSTGRRRSHELHIPAARLTAPADLHRPHTRVCFIRCSACSSIRLRQRHFIAIPPSATGLGRTNGVGANGLTIFSRRRMPQIGNHVYATQVDGCGLRIFFFCRSSFC